jgi:uncharacterized protein YdaU (DUF1376 family)
MPFHIDKFRGSPAVQAMHPCARSGYLYLLSFQWQSEDGTIPDDPLILADLSGLGDELWAAHGERILRKFFRLDGKLLRNLVLHSEWEEARRIYEARQAAAHRTTELRSVNGHRTVTEGRPLRSADTITGTITRTKTETKDSAPNGAVAARPEEFGNIWNRERGTLPKITEFTESRRRRVKTRIGQGITLEKFRDAVRKCRDTPFLRGESKEGWQADFDWLIRNDSNIFKVLEGKYDGNTNGFHSESKTERLEREVQELLDRETVDSA